MGRYCCLIQDMCKGAACTVLEMLLHMVWMGIGNFEENYRKLCPILYHPVAVNLQEIRKFPVLGQMPGILFVLYNFFTFPGIGNFIFGPVYRVPSDSHPDTNVSA